MDLSSTTPQSQINQNILGVSYPGKYTQGANQMIVLSRKDVYFLVLFDNGYIGQYDADGVLRTYFDSRLMTNINVSLLTSTTVSFDYNNAKYHFAMDVQKSTANTMATAAGGAVGLFSLMNAQSSAVELFNNIREGKYQFNNVTANLPQKITVPDYAEQLRKEGKNFYIIGACLLGLATLILVFGYLAWYLWLFGFALVLGGYVRNRRAS